MCGLSSTSSNNVTDLLAVIIVGIVVAIGLIVLIVRDISKGD